MTLIFQSLLFLRKDDENGKGGTLSGNKLNAYVLLKIFKILFGISLSSFSLKFAIDRSLVDERSEFLSNQLIPVSKVENLYHSSTTLGLN